MNLDLSASMTFGDQSGLRTFLLDHQMVHDQTAAALSKKLGGTYSSFGLSSSIAEEDWVRIMQTRQGPMPQALQDWLQIHALIHDTTYQALSGVGTVAPDLSVADFSKPESFYDWMYVHMQMHDYEQQVLRLS